MAHQTNHLGILALNTVHELDRSVVSSHLAVLPEQGTRLMSQNFLPAPKICKGRIERTKNGPRGLVTKTRIPKWGEKNGKNRSPHHLDSMFGPSQTTSKPSGDRRSLVVQLYQLTAEDKQVLLGLLNIGLPFHWIFVLPAADITLRFLDLTFFGLHVLAVSALLRQLIDEVVQWPRRPSACLAHAMLELTSHLHVSPFVITT